MDYFTLFQKLETHSNKNKDTFNDITGILYFNNEESQQNVNFLDDNKSQVLFDIKETNTETIEKVDTFKNTSYYVKTHVNLLEYNLTKKFENLTDCMLNVINYFNLNAKNIFFKKLLKDYDVFNLYKKFNYKKDIRRRDLRTLLINKEENNENVKQLLVDYLNINLVLITNDDIKLYCKDKDFEIYRPTIIIYEYENKYYSLEDKKTQNGIFTSEDLINIRLKKLKLNEEIKNIQPKETSVKIKMEVKEETVVVINFKKMKVNELRAYCEQNGVDIKIKKSTKKGFKYMTKKQILEKLSKLN